MAAAPDDDARRTLAELEAKLRDLERELLRGRDDQAAAPAPAPPPPAEPTPTADAPPPAFAEPAAEATPFAADAEPAEPPAFDAAPPPSAADEPEPEPPGAEVLPLAEPLAAEAVPFAPAPPAAPEPPVEELGVAWPAPAPAAPEETPEPAATLDLDALDDAQDILDSLRATIAALTETAERIAAEARLVVGEHGRTLARLDLAARAAAAAEQAAMEAGRVASTVVVDAGPFADPRALLALLDALAAQPDAKDAYVRGVEDGRAVIEVHLAPPP